jgi:hypothetical protein
MVMELFFIVAVVLGCSGLSNSVDSGVEVFGELESAETSLYDQGPIDLPVTIAKLDSIDSALVTIEYSDSLTQELLRSLASQSAVSSGGYVITGEAGAINVDQATKLFALNTSTSELTVLEIAADGSFVLEMEAEEGQVIALAPMVDAEDQIGAPIYADEENGVDTIALTNSDFLNPNVNIEVNPDGYAYFSAEALDGTYEIYRRNLDGTTLETVATGISSQVRFIVLDEQGSLNYVTQDGKVFSILLAETSTDISSLAAKGSVTPAYLDYEDPVELMSFGDALDDADTFVPAPVEVFRVGSGSYRGMTFVSNKRQVNSGAEGIVQPSFLRFIEVDSGTTTHEFLSTSDYHSAEFSLGEVDTLFVAAEPNDTTEAQSFRPFELYELDMTLGATAWENRTLFYSHATRGESLISMKSTRNNSVVFIVQNAVTGTNSIYSLREGESPVAVAGSPTGDKIYSEFIALTEYNPIGNTSFVTCATDASEGVSYLAKHNIDRDDPGVFYRITSTTNKDGCKGNYAIDNENRVMFYRSEVVDGVEQAPQISFIDLDNLNSDELVLDE